MTEITSLDGLVQKVPDGCRIGIGGVHFSRLPIALIEALLASGKGRFTFVSWGGGLALELFLEARAVRKLAFCFSSLDIFGLAPRFREAMESGAIEVEEWSALAMIEALKAAQFNLPEMPFQIPYGSDLMKAGTFWREAKSAFTHEPLGLARRLDIDVMLLHAQQADRQGNVEIQGARGLDLSMIGAARNVLVTVEEISDAQQIGTAPRSFVLPKAFVTAVACVPFGAYPTSCLPYYTTDYSRLLAYVSSWHAPQNELNGSQPPKGIGPSPEQQGEKQAFVCSGTRKAFLRRAAKCTIKALTPDLLRLHALPVQKDSEYTPDELLAVCLAREYDDSSVCSVGSVSPLAMVSYLLAKRTHAPHLTLIALNGGFVDIDPHPMLLTLSEALEFQSAKAWWGGDETYHWYYQSGRITHEVITVAQIDVQGRTNNAWIQTRGKRVRLPGQGGMADVANLHQNFVLYLTRHSPERFVEKVDFCTAARGLLTSAERARAGLQPGTVRLISDLGIFELDINHRKFRLVSIHPGVTLARVQAQTGGPLLVAEPLPETEPPSRQQLRLIREEVDPFGIRRLEFVPSKKRSTMIAAILQAEERLISEILAAEEESGTDF